MAETGAVFGGEHSGHYYFRDNYRADSGLIAAVVALEALSLAGRPLSEVLAPFRRYHASGEINSRVDDRTAKIEGSRPHTATGWTGRTASPSSSTTGGSTSGRRTPSRCCV